MNRIEAIEKAPKARGKRELLRHHAGLRLTLKQALLAKCCECSGYYIDGKNDCQIPDCPLYSNMPYRKP